RNDGYAVYGFGQKQTPLPFVKACSTFLFLEKLGEDGDVSASQARPRTEAELRDDRALAQLLRGAVVAVADDEGWAHLGGVGSHLGNQGSFDSRNYGYRSLSALIDAVGLFEVRREGQTVLIREKPKARGRRTKTAKAAQLRSTGSTSSDQRTRRASGRAWIAGSAACSAACSWRRSPADSSSWARCMPARLGIGAGIGPLSAGASPPDAGASSNARRTACRKASGGPAWRASARSSARCANGGNPAASRSASASAAKAW